MRSHLCAKPSRNLRPGVSCNSHAVAVHTARRYGTVRPRFGNEILAGADLLPNDFAKAPLKIRAERAH